jgi:hypothetical protein
LGINFTLGINDGDQMLGCHYAKNDSGDQLSHKGFPGFPSENQGLRGSKCQKTMTNDPRSLQKIMNSKHNDPLQRVLSFC